MGGVHSLRFVDDVHPGSLQDLSLDFLEEQLPLLDSPDPEAFVPLLSGPLCWKDIEQEIPGPAELASAAVPAELLIALHKAGAPVEELELSVLPLYSNFLMLRPGSGWEDLAAACQNLKAFKC